MLDRVSLIDSPSARSDVTGSQSTNTPPQADSGTNRIGQRLEQIRQRLLFRALDLAPRLDALAQPLVAESQRLLERRSCKIAVIGQIKAGKSTFINALAGRPGLLPADINPWTAVVTLLHFRDASTPPSPAAAFQFFSEAEWSALAEGGGRLRELTRQLIPNFEPQLLKAQFEIMRARAERRLGTQFNALLGQTHAFNDITYAHLTAYVSAGDDAYGDPYAPATPCYSDIVRAADLYFSAGPFAFPATIVDTPGINDPFLVRDEISRRNLENPDILLFVLSALQPLTAADIAMLRLINGMQKDRILVFINRVDQLADPAREGQAIKHNVEQRLAREFPSLSIPVVIGSASWANRALQPNMAGAHALHVASGMPQVCEQLCAMMANSNTASLMIHIATCLLELTRGKEVALRLEEAQRRPAHIPHQNPLGDPSAMSLEHRQERDVLADFDNRAIKLQSVLDEIETHLNALVASKSAPLQRNLDAIVHRFAHQQGKTLEETLRHATTRAPWICDVMPLREALEDHYLDACAVIDGELNAVIVEIQPIIRRAVEALLPGSGEAFDDVARTTAPNRPSVQPLRKTLVLDLGVSWWRLGFGPKPDPAERISHLKSLIAEDFLPLTAELAREADSHFGWSIAHTLDKARAVAESILATVRRRNDELRVAAAAPLASQHKPIAPQIDSGHDIANQRVHLTASITELTHLLKALRSPT